MGGALCKVHYVKPSGVPPYVKSIRLGYVTWHAPCLGAWSEVMSHDVRTKNAPASVDTGALALRDKSLI